MSSRRAKTPGWAAFDPKKQHKQVTNIETHDDPYPPISSNISTLHHCQNSLRNGDLTGKSFSSVLTHSKSAPNVIASEVTHSSVNVPNTLIYEKLKELHPWANENLIEDIVAAVDNDIDLASNLLKDMSAPGRVPEKKETEFEANIEEVYLDSSSLESVGQSSLTINNGEQLDDHNYYGKVVFGDNLPLGLIINSLNMIPMEPEWEDDDVYLIHRKEAIRAMRLASRHSKAASEAYLRRDHAAAQEFSQKAQQEWHNAEKLNAKAAKEILAIRNSENDEWKLDLHGLHAAEAVHVLLEHLLKIESQVSRNHSTKPDKTNLKVHSTEKSDRPQQLFKPILLEVITGKGNHSRGEAALPVAIKNFLSEKGYYYYEARTGIITVQPKFRQL